MKFKKALALILAAQMLLCSLAACNGNTDDETTAPESTPVETKAPATTEPGETEFDRTTIADNLPDVNYNGQEFRILTIEEYGDNGLNPSLQYIYDEDLKGDALNDAIRKRNEDVENRFGTKIATYLSDGRETQDIMRDNALSGIDEYEIVDMMQYMSYVPMIEGLSLDWSNIPHLDLTKPWWNKQSNDQATINGKIYRLTGDLSLTSLQYCWALAFNMDLMEDWGYSADALYQLVFDGEWTIDKMIEITSSMYLDTDKDNTKSVGDTYGYSTWTSAGTDPWLLAIDARILDKNDEGYLEVFLGTERVYSTIEKLNNFIYTTEGCFNYKEDEAHPEFADGQIGIVSTSLGDCTDKFARLGFEYGLLPYPKYDTAQKNYVTTGMDQLSVYSVPATMDPARYDFIGVITEALNAESYKTVYPAYFDGALKGRYSTDANMAEVMDIIVEGRRFDLAYLYGIYIYRLPYQFRYCIRDNSTDLASKLANNEGNINDAIDALMEFYLTGEPVY